MIVIAFPINFRFIYGVIDLLMLNKMIRRGTFNQIYLENINFNLKLNFKSKSVLIKLILIQQKIGI